jgi:integrase/recombinase XerD
MQSDDGSGSPEEDSFHWKSHQKLGSRLRYPPLLIHYPDDFVDLTPNNVIVEDHTTVNNWLRSKRSEHTQEAYARDIKSFYGFLIENNRSSTIRGVKLEDVQDYAYHLKCICKEISTQARKIAVVKSLLTFAHKTGYIDFNVGAAQILPEGKDKLSQRILSTSQVQNMIYEARNNKRNHAMLLLLYGSGIRCAELCGLQWKDVQETTTGGQITVLGKGNKTRSIPLHKVVWDELISIRPPDASPSGYVFQSRKSVHQGRLTETQVWKIVKRYAEAAGVKKASTHWFRHAHAAHAMEKGAPLRLIQETLGHADLRTPSRYQHVRPEASSSQFLDL